MFSLFALRLISFSVRSKNIPSAPEPRVQQKLLFLPSDPKNRTLVNCVQNKPTNQTNKTSWLYPKCYEPTLSLSHTMRIESTNSIDYGSKENRWTNWEKTHLLTSNLIVFGGKKGWSTTPPNTPTSLTTNPPKY